MRLFFLLLPFACTPLSCTTKQLKVGESFTIDLASNLTTGYSWRCICTPEDHVAITNKYARTATTTHLAGAGGVETFTLTAQKVGIVDCILEYGRPWDPKSYGKTKKYRIKIKK